MEPWQEMEDWFPTWFATFWGVYNGKKLCGNSTKKGPKTKALESAKRKVKTKEKAKVIIDALRAQIRYHEECKRKGDWQPNFPMVMTWVNQERWSTEIDSHSDIQDKRINPSKQCAEPGCNKPVIGPRYPSCAFHETYTEEVQQEEREWLARHGLTNATTQELIAFCKELKPKLVKQMP